MANLVCPGVELRHYLAKLILANLCLPWVSSLFKLLEISLDLLFLHSGVGGEEGQVDGGEGGGGAAHGDYNLKTSLKSRKTPF